MASTQIARRGLRTSARLSQQFPAPPSADDFVEPDLPVRGARGRRKKQAGDDGERSIGGRARMDMPVKEWLTKGEGAKFKDGTPGKPNWIGATPFPLNPTFKPPPPISDTIKSQMALLHKRDPKEFSPRQLSQDFNVSIDRVRAILRLKALEDEWVAQGKPLQVHHLAGMESHLGVPTSRKGASKASSSAQILELLSATQPVDPEPAESSAVPPPASSPSNPRLPRKQSLGDPTVWAVLEDNEYGRVSAAAAQIEDIERAVRAQETKAKETEEIEFDLTGKRVQDQAKSVRGKWQFVDLGKVKTEKELRRAERRRERRKIERSVKGLSEEGDELLDGLENEAGKARHEAGEEKRA